MNVDLEKPYTDFEKIEEFVTHRVAIKIKYLNQSEENAIRSTIEELPEDIKNFLSDKTIDKSKDLVQYCQLFDRVVINRQRMNLAEVNQEMRTFEDEVNNVQNEDYEISLNTNVSNVSNVLPVERLNQARKRKIEDSDNDSDDSSNNDLKKRKFKRT